MHNIQLLLEQEQTKLKEPKFVRWLSHDAAVKALIKSLSSVVAALEREATENCDLATAGYVRKMKTFKFVASLLLFGDVLPHLTQLSKTF